MLHLFNKVYLEHENYIDYFDNDQLIIINLKASSQQYPKTDKLIKYGNTISDVIEEGQTLQNLMVELMSTDKKTVIFADNNSFGKIYASWIKSTVNIDQSSFDVLMDCYGHKLKIYSMGNQDLIASCKEAFEEAETFDYSGVSFKPSYEFLLSSAFVNKEFSRKENLKTCMLDFVKRDYESHILEARWLIDSNILDADMQKLLGGEGKTVNNYHDLPWMSVFKSPFFTEVSSGKPNANYSPGVNGRLDLSKASGEDLELLLQLTVNVFVNVIGNNYLPSYSSADDTRIVNNTDWPYMTSIKNKELSDDDYNNILDSILSHKILFPYVPDELRNTINFVALGHFKSLMQENKTSSLEKFSLK